jgi:hypothetical protein
MLMNLAGIISSAVFREQDAPVYKPALIIVATFQGCYIVMALVVRVYYTRLNKKIENGEHVVKGMEHNPDY